MTTDNLEFLQTEASNYRDVGSPYSTEYAVQFEACAYELESLRKIVDELIEWRGIAPSDQVKLARIIARAKELRR